MSRHLYIICRGCKHRDRDASKGFSPCTVDGEWFMRHVEERFCPAGKFPNRGIGDVVAWLAFTPMGRRVRALFQAAGRKCGRCLKRQRRLNASFWGMVEWMREWTRLI